MEEQFLLAVHCTEVSDVRHIEICTEEYLVPETNAFEVEMAIHKLKGHKSPGTDHITAELIKAAGSKICSEIH